MDLVLKNSNYVHPLTGEIFQDLYVVDGEFSDIPILQKLKISMWLCRDYLSYSYDENMNPIKAKKMKVLDSDFLEFTMDFSIPTYVTKQGNTQDLFEYLKTGGELDGSENIEVGYPSYSSVQTYFEKDNIGDKLIFNSKLDPLSLTLAKEFVLTKWKLNGQPLGVQFKFNQ